MYTTFFAIISLVFYALENLDNDASQDVLRVATEGQDTLRKLTNRSMAADRCSATLQALFEQLPDRVRRSRQTSAAGKKRKQDSMSNGPQQNPADIDAAELNPPSRAATFPHVHSRNTSKDIAMADASNLPGSDADYGRQTTAHLYDMLQRNNLEAMIASPSLTSGLSQAQDSFPPSPVDTKDQNFPLADLSAVMFPSADPVAYPDQSLSAGQSYEDILKSLASDPTFPFPTSFNEFRAQRAAGVGTFVPPSSTFMFNNGEASDQTQVYDSDIQLLGPMPAYMMHGGGSFPPNSGMNTSDNGGMNTGPEFTSQFLHQPGNGVPAAQNGGQNLNPLSNLDLEQLLSGEEWSNLNQNTGYGSVMPHNVFGSQAALTSSPAGDFGVGIGQPQVAGASLSLPSSKGASTRNSMDVSDRAHSGSKNVSFDDLNPSGFGWNLGGY